MEYKEITNLLGNITDKVPRFITEKWIELYKQSRGSYNTNKQIRFKTSMLQANLGDYSNTYVVFKGILELQDQIILHTTKKSAFNNNSPFTSCVSRFDNTHTDNAENLDVVIPSYNLL